MEDLNKQFEQKHLNEIIEKLNNSIEETKNKLQYNKEQLSEIESAWKDVRFKQGDYNAIVETASSIRSQQQQIQQRENASNQAEYQLTTYFKQKEKPYFARIDFTENDNAESIYIGLASFSQNDQYFIYDWRAPIASIYYDGGLGDVKYQTPAGEKVANVTLKRQFQIEDGVILTLFDTEETIGDQMLLNALSNNSSTKMKSIVTTIQKEQNQIIRDTQSDLLFVQGAAGSGKTAAVLQRIAYLLYRYRKNLTSGQVILFSPNQLFNDYINQVLPDLGEQNMVQMTFYQFVNYRLPKILVQSLAKRFELENRPENHAINHLKGSLQVARAVELFAKSLNNNGMNFRDIKRDDDVILSATEIEEIYYSFNQSYSLAQRLDATKEKLIQLVTAKAGQNINSNWVEEAIENLTESQIRSLVGDPEKYEDLSKKLARVIVKNSFAPVLRRIKANGFINPNKIFASFLKQITKYVDIYQFNVTDSQIQNSIQKSLEELSNKELNTNDSAIYLYLYDLITAHRGQYDMRFVFIDEVQDYTPLQLAFLKHSFPNAKFTLLGDLNQAIFTGNNANNLRKELENLFKTKTIRFIQLNQTYRSTQQISDFAREILDHSQNIVAFEREGSLPSVVEVKTRDAKNQFIIQKINEIKESNQTVAIITKDAQQATEIQKVLEENKEQSTLILQENQRLATGIIVIPSYLAKGLEFDVVILPDVDEQHFNSETEKQLLYTLSTRAMHDLTLISVGPISNLIKKIDNSLYRVYNY
ncbi:MAG: AAA family ATPase [Lactobacillaceae bacterium]|jgi:DNA helicase-2/ATP-dependent DNA helicase PcrA|nr:AAA family ATPase [Lactobacillaceae bacterium]